MKRWIQTYGWLAAALLCIGAALLGAPQIGKEALVFGGKNMVQFLIVLPPVFLCVGLMDVWVDQTRMMRIIGADSGLKGMAIALVAGMMTAVPLYALFPIAPVLFKKGARISNVLIFLGASAGVRVPLLLFELSCLGAPFSLVLFGLSLLFLPVMALVIESRLSETEKEEIYERANML